MSVPPESMGSSAVKACAPARICCANPPASP